MKHDIHTVKSFRIAAPYTLSVCFGNGKEKEIDFRPVLKGPVYGPLHDADFFRQVKLDTEVNTLVWPNGADFDPALLYHWEEYIDELTNRAATWQATADESKS